MPGRQPDAGNACDDAARRATEPGAAAYPAGTRTTLRSVPWLFVGLSDESLTITDKLQPRLHSVLIGEGGSCWQADAAAMRYCRAGYRQIGQAAQYQGIAPEPQLEIMAGDVLVLLGLPDDLATAEYRLLHG